MVRAKHVDLDLRLKQCADLPCKPWLSNPTLSFEHLPFGVSIVARLVYCI